MWLREVFAKNSKMTHSKPTITGNQITYFKFLLKLWKDGQYAFELV